MWEIQIVGIDFFRVFWCFFIYCFVGWIWECCYCSVMEGKLINRGFLNGPVIPIYGCAATAIFMVFFNPLMEAIAVEQSARSYLIIFGLGAVVASAFEYITSWSMELMFHAKWWDYSHVPLNIKGRICLPISCFWGVASIALVKLLHPFVLGIIDGFNRNAGEIVGYVVFVIFVTDTVTTVVATVQLDKKITAIAKIRVELGDVLKSVNEFEINSKIAFKEKYGETPIGDVVEHGFDRVDATIAFLTQWHDENMKSFDDNMSKNVDNVNSVLEKNKTHLDKFITNEKDKLAGILNTAQGTLTKIRGSFTGYNKYTAERLALAFPNMKFTGVRKEAMKEIVEKTGLFNKDKKKSKKDQENS